MTDLATLRPATPEDAEFLLRVYASTRAEELAQVQWAPGQQEAFLRMQVAAQTAHFRNVFPDMESWVIVHDGEDAGRIILARLPHEWRLVDVALLPEHRCQGVGSRLMRDLLAQATEAGIPVTLHVETFNPALRLYERLGFEHMEQRSIHWFMRWTPPGAVRD